MSVNVTLTQYEIYIASFVGSARRVASLKRGETNKVQNKDFGWHTDIEGAAAEMALAKALNIFWGGSVNTFKLPDVGGLQVRHTQHENGCLIVRKGDDLDAVFVLVTGSHPHYKISGWTFGRDAMKDCYVRDPNSNYPAWFVPQSDLVSMGELKNNG